MCKFKNYPDTFHDKWKYPTKSFGCIASSILPSTSLTPQLNLFPTIIRDISTLSLFWVLLLLLLLHYPRFSTSTFLPTSNSLFNFYHSFPFSCYLFIYLSAFLYKSNKDASIISIFLALLGVDRREKWPLCSFLSLMIVRTKR